MRAVHRLKFRGLVAARHRLPTHVQATLGDGPTDTLMSLLPPVGWADVARRQDLDSLHNALRAEMHATVRSAMFGMIGAMFTLAGLTWAAVTLG